MPMMKAKGQGQHGSAMTEAWLVRTDGSRTDMPAVDRRIRAAVVTAMRIGIPLLHEHVSRALGTDMFGPAGDRLIALALLDIYSHALVQVPKSSPPSVRRGGLGLRGSRYLGVDFVHEGQTPSLRTYNNLGPFSANR